MHRELTPILQEMANYSYAPHQSSQAYFDQDVYGNGLKTLLSSKEYNHNLHFPHHDLRINKNLFTGKVQNFTTDSDASLPINDSRENSKQCFRSVISATDETPLQSIESNLFPLDSSEHLAQKNDNIPTGYNVSTTQQNQDALQELSFGLVKRLPLNLPKPPLTFISNPYENLPQHVYKHGLIEDANNFARARGITVEFALLKWVQYSGEEGSNGLLKMTSWLMDTFQARLIEQLAQAQTDNHVLPKHFNIPSNELNTRVQEGNARGEKFTLPPTHVLAIHSNHAGPEEENGLLIPCHAMLYVLQCVSLPRFGESTVTMDGIHDKSSQQSFPVVPILVPRPKEFVHVHRFIYTRDAASLLAELLPMQQILIHTKQRRVQDQFASASLGASTTYGSSLASFTNSILSFHESMQLFQYESASQQAIEFLSEQPVHDLFTIAYRINAIWANGVAIGFIDTSFWKALQTGWTLVITALACKKGRYADIESRGLDIGLRKV